jgi:RNA polymerase sigma-70 factor, ECF subfamily
MQEESPGNRISRIRNYISKNTLRLVLLCAFAALRETPTRFVPSIVSRNFAEKTDIALFWPNEYLLCMMDPTMLLEEARSGNEEALHQLIPVVYDELHRIASENLRSAGPGQTMLTTDLVHESFLKLIGSRNLSWQNRLHFFAIAATSMRQIIVDHARARHAGKRGGSRIRIPLEDDLIPGDQGLDDIEELDDALCALEKTDARSARIIELRFFGGLNNEEIAELLNISERTVFRDWEFARAWLYRFLNNKRTT